MSAPAEPQASHVQYQVLRMSLTRSSSPLRFEYQAPVVTSDTGDITRIADALGVKIRLYPV